jgi:hypothetical protein
LNRQEKELLWPAPIAYVEKLSGLHVLELFWLPVELEWPLVAHSYAAAGRIQSLVQQEKELLWLAPCAHVQKLGGLHLFEIFWLPVDPEWHLGVHSCGAMGQNHHLARQEKELLWLAPFVHVQKLGGLHLLEVF